MITGLFHYTIGFPKGLKTNFGNIKLNYTKHALKASQNDRYGYIKLPKKINTDRAQAVEVEIIRNRVTKIVYRLHYNDALDLIVVIDSEYNAKTVWLNRKKDKHFTLNINKYTKP